MILCQNGLPASPNREHIVTRTVPGASVQIPVHDGPAGDLLMYFAARWHREVEPLHVGWCWGWSYRAVRGATDLSNHSGGWAIDLNAPTHPLGTSPAASFSPAQIAAIHRILADCQGCIRWGGDYQGRQDPMHSEVVKSETECARVLNLLNGWINVEDTMVPVLAAGDGAKGALNGRGHLHWWVVSVQALLNVRGMSQQVVQDGVFGESTTAMVKELQGRNGLTQTGVVDAATWQWLLGNDAPDFS